MVFPKVNIITDPLDDFEAQLICFLAKGITTRTYQDGNFLITPDLEWKNAKTVYFPPLPYSTNFWRTLNFNPNINLSSNYTIEIISEVKNLLAQNKENKYQKEIEKIKNNWQKIEKSFWKDVNKFLDFKKAISKVDEIDVLLTPYGTLGSFNPPRVGNKFKLLVTSRVDFSSGNIAAGILQNLYIIENWTGGEIESEKYLKRMSSIAFIFENTIFKKYYPDFINIIKPQFTFSKALILKSDKYLEELGFPKKEMKIDIQNKIFSNQEKILLSELMKNKNELISFDTIASLFWKDAAEDKFSLEAIAKVVENTRSKLKALGINKELIFTKRGEGYYFNS